MPELHDLGPAPGSAHPRKRVGRGPGSGTGKTSGRGHKGQKSRSGASIARGFEGGQMPLQRRIPKRGFTPLTTTVHQVVNLRDLALVEGSEITPERLRRAGLTGSLKRPVKILADGNVDRALSVTVHAVSKSAREKIEAAGGTVSLLGAGKAPKTAADPG